MACLEKWLKDVDSFVSLKKDILGKEILLDNKDRFMPGESARKDILVPVLTEILAGFKRKFLRRLSGNQSNLTPQDKEKGKNTPCHASLPVEIS